ICNVSDYGVLNFAGTLTATNVFCAYCLGACFGGTITQSYNISSDATASGTGSITNVVIATQFVNSSPGSVDLHLLVGSDAVNKGAGLSATFTRDIDDEARPVGTAWDIGADEYTGTNYRSVGTNTGTLYSTGLASINWGTSTVTFGGGASLPTNVGQGDKLT